MAGKIGAVYSGISSGGVRVPNGAYLIDAGSADVASAIQALDGSTFSRTGKPSLYTAWKYAGYLGAKDASFYPSSSSIVTMTNATTPSGYTVTARGYTSAYYPYQVFDNNLSTLWEDDLGELSPTWIQLAHPTVVPFKYDITTYGTSNYYPLSGKIEENNGSSLITTVSEIGGFYNTKTLYPSSYINSVASLFTFNSHVGAALQLKEIKIYPADLSVIKCVAHGFTTGDAVRCGVESGKTIPTGITEDTTYYVRQGADADKLYLYDTYAHAVAGGSTGLITITDAGSGTFKIYPADTILLSTVTNGKLYY